MRTILVVANETMGSAQLMQRGMEMRMALCFLWRVGDLTGHAGGRRALLGARGQRADGHGGDQG